MPSFHELFGGGQALDRVRNQRMPQSGPTLDYLGESLFKFCLPFVALLTLLQRKPSPLKTGL